MFEWFWFFMDDVAISSNDLMGFHSGNLKCGNKESYYLVSHTTAAVMYDETTFGDLDPAVLRGYISTSNSDDATGEKLDKIITYYRKMNMTEKQINSFKYRDGDINTIALVAEHICNMHHGPAPV